jgi:hypothetical protein
MIHQGLEIGIHVAGQLQLEVIVKSLEKETLLVCIISNLVGSITR